MTCSQRISGFKDSRGAASKIAELQIDAPSVKHAAGRPLVHYWPLIQAQARTMLLPPHCGVADRRVSWTWSEAVELSPVTTAEFSQLRTRLREMSRAMSDAAALQGRGEVDPSTREVLVATAAMAMALAAKSDSALGAYTARTTAGLRLHSWCSTIPARPRSAETQELEIAGTVIVGGKPDGGHRVVLEDARGGVVARTRSDSQGRFLFAELAPGRYRVRGVPEQVDFPVTGLAVELSSGPVRGLELKSSARRGQKEPAKTGAKAPADTVTAVPSSAASPTETASSSRRRWTGWIVAGVVAVAILIGTLFMSRRDEKRSSASEWLATSEVAADAVQRKTKSATMERLAANEVSTAVTAEGVTERVLDHEKRAEAVREEETAAPAELDSPMPTPSAEETAPDEWATARSRSPAVPAYTGAAASASHLATPAAGNGLPAPARSGAAAASADQSVANAGGGSAAVAPDTATKAKTAASAGEPAPDATPRPGALAQSPTESAVPLTATAADNASKPQSRADPDPTTMAASKPASPSDESRRSGKAVGPRSEAAAEHHEPADDEDSADQKAETGEDHADTGNTLASNATASLRRAHSIPREDAAISSPASSASTSETEDTPENPALVKTDPSRGERPQFLRGLPSSSLSARQRWEGQLRRSPWQLALTRDAVVLTRPVVEGQVDPSEMSRLALLKQKQAEVSPGFATASFAWGVAIAPDERIAQATWRVTHGRSTVIERREDGRVVLVLPATPASGTRYELQTPEAAESLARLEIDQAGRLRINVVPGLRAAFWFSAEPKPAGIATENHGKTWPSELQWRLLDGQPLPASWREGHHQASDARRSWLEIPLEKAEGASRFYPVALIDPASDWAWRSYLQFE